MAGALMRFPGDAEVRSFATGTAVLLVGFQDRCRPTAGRSGEDVVRATARFLEIAATTDSLIVAAPAVRAPISVPSGAVVAPHGGRNGTVSAPGAFAHPGEAFGAFHSQIVEMRGDGALHAFADTGLDEALAERGIRDVVIASAVTCASTDATARAARALGYRVTLLSDCMLHGSRSEHRLICEAAIPLYAEVASSAEVARRLRNGRREDASPPVGASDEELQVLLRHQLLEALAEREGEAAAVQRLSGLGGWSWSPGDDVLTWSDAILRLFGAGATTPPPNLDGFLTLIHPFDRERVAEILYTAATTGEPFRFHHRLRSDEHRMFRVIGDVESTGDGVTRRVRGITQEITGGTAASSAPDTRDPLTGLANHALFLDYADRAMARASRFGWTTAVVIVDIDRFRQINEAHGHVAADEVLTEMARRLSDTLRGSDLVSRTAPSATDPDDLVSRWGGDRFAAICENTSDEEAVLTLIRRIQSIACEPIVLAGGRTVDVTIGIGAAIAGPGVMPVEQQIRDAEDALRLAKASGPSGCELARDGAASRRHGHRDAAAALQQALDNQEFVLHFQPKLSLEADRFIGAEALLRWQHPVRGLVPPLEFIPLAEETGMIVPIGAWVIEESCRQFAEWHRLFPHWPRLIVAVNVSGQQFGPALVTTVADALERTGAGAGQLCLEVTESTLITDADGAIETLHRLTELGVKVSIDDFGTGYSSLSYLKRLPLHELKIDKSFVDGLGEDPEDTAIVGATVAMAHALGLSVVAEGVETADQLERLRVLGCQEVQGYYVARPMAADAFAQLLSSEANGGWRATGGGDRVAISSSPRAARVLIVDDTPDVRQLARMALNASGFEVFEAADGSEAVAMVSQLRPDCVLLDVSMPGISGLQVCRVLRSDPANDGCTIVMLTADPDAGPKVQAFGAGADDYIVKPFSPRDLVGRVRAALRVHDQVHS